MNSPLDFAGRLVPAILDADRRCLRCAERARPSSPELAAGAACEPCVIAEVARLVSGVTLAPRTVRGYLGAWRNWEAWCARRQVSPELVTDAELSAFLVARRTEGLGPRSGLQELANLRALCGHGQRTVEIGASVRILKRRFAREAEETPLRHARPLRPEDLTAIACRIEKDGVSRMQRLRDNALVCFGWSIGARPVDLSKLRWSMLAFGQSYVTVHVPRTKTKPRIAHVLRARVIERCPVVAIERWRAACCAMDSDGPVFVAVDRFGARGRGRLGTQEISRIIATNALDAGLGPGYGGGSLRSGFVSTATELGIANTDIMAVTGHKTEKALSAYQRGIVEFRNPALKLL